MSPSVEPFNESKYRTLMDGLEATEISFSYIISANDILRLDSFYFSKAFLQEENIINTIHHLPLKQMMKSLRSFGAYSLNNEVEYIEKGVPLIRGVNLKAGTVDFSNMVFISEKSHKLLWKSEVYPKTILLSMSGTIGDVALANDFLPYPINSNQDIAKIELKKGFNPYFVFAFLGTKYGQNYLLREARGSVQQHVFLSQIEQFKIPIFSPQFQNMVEYIVNSFHEKLEKSKQLYFNAESLLLSNLGFENYTLNTSGIAIKSFKSSFGISGRFDSEYYQPKYEEIETRISAEGTVASSCILHDTNFVPDDKVEYRYIELSNIGKNGEISDVKIAVGEDLPTRARRLVKKGQVIVSSIEGSLGSCALIYDEYDGAVCSTGFYIVSSDKINSETLLTIFKSSAIQALMKKRCSGTILTAINKDEFLSLPIPTVDTDIQLEIAKKIKESFALRKKSIELLELAKTAVEVAIEQGEDNAMVLLGGTVCSSKSQ